MAQISVIEQCGKDRNWVCICPNVKDSWARVFMSTDAVTVGTSFVPKTQVTVIQGDSGHLDQDSGQMWTVCLGHKNFQEHRLKQS